MTTRTESSPWDLSHVLDLVNSLSSQNVGISDGVPEALGASPSLSLSHSEKTHFNGVDQKDFATPPPTRLGDFGKVWQFLGSPLVSPAPEVPPLTAERAATRSTLTNKDDYASDGAAYFNPTRSGKGVKWQDQQAAEEQENDTLTDYSTSPDTPNSPTLTKTQRKKQRRKERKAKESAEAARSATVSESEVDNVSRKTPARAASAHVVSSSATKRYNLRSRDPSGKAVVSPSVDVTPTPSPKKVDQTPDTIATNIEIARARVAEKLHALKQAPSENAVPRQNTPSTPPTTRHSLVSKQQLQPSSVPNLQRTSSAHDANYSANTNGQSKWPVPTRQDANAYQQSISSRFVPSTVQPSSKSTAPPSIAPQAATASPVRPSNPVTPSGRSKVMIEPKIVRSGEDRHWALLMKLIGDFYEDRKHIISPMNLTTHNNHPNGIHVFVDASNIFIGFTEQLKRSRGIPAWTQVPNVDLSFDALALLMERRRPVAKRVLVGSTPHLPAFDKAKAVGYECNILEKVYKARELTERQIYFKEHDRNGQYRKSAKAPSANTVAAANGLVTNNGVVGSGSGSGSETNAPQYAPARMIEQGVDEILHLKILESVIDTETPSTIVLATGDAAQAEYSQGFMAMSERALKKGWKVELVSWSKNVSMLYRRREWVEAWGDNFKVIYLDDYAEELLDM